MDRPTLRSALPSPEPRTPLPFELDEDPADESIYGMGYRTRVGVVVSDRAAAPADAAADAAAATPGARG